MNNFSTIIFWGESFPRAEVQNRQWRRRDAGAALLPRCLTASDHGVAPRSCSVLSCEILFQIDSMMWR